MSYATPLRARRNLSILRGSSRRRQRLRKMSKVAHDLIPEKTLLILGLICRTRLQNCIPTRVPWSQTTSCNQDVESSSSHGLFRDAHDMRPELQRRTRHSHLRSCPAYSYQTLAKQRRLQLVCSLERWLFRKRHLTHVVSGPVLQKLAEAIYIALDFTAHVESELRVRYYANFPMSTPTWARS